MLAPPTKLLINRTLGLTMGRDNFRCPIFAGSSLQYKARLLREYCHDNETRTIERRQTPLTVSDYRESAPFLWGLEKVMATVDFRDTHMAASKFIAHIEPISLHTTYILNGIGTSWASQTCDKP